MGYNGYDPHVPRPAYEALIHRVQSLETSLGTANRELRGYAARVEELEGQALKLTHAVKERDAQLLRMEDKERELVTLRALCVAQQREKEQLLLMTQYPPPGLSHVNTTRELKEKRSSMGRKKPFLEDIPTQDDGGGEDVLISNSGHHFSSSMGLTTSNACISGTNNSHNLNSSSTANSATTPVPSTATSLPRLPAIVGAGGNRSQTSLGFSYIH
jgi:hypothetical protein